MSRFNNAVNELLEIIASKVPDGHLDYPLKAYVVGGVAINFYTSYRMSNDIDIQFERSIKDLPKDLFVPYLSEDGTFQELFLDSNYNDTLGLMQEDYQDRAVDYKTFDKKFVVKIIAPVDLVISKTLRFSSKDEEDIKELVYSGLINKEEYISLVDDAIKVGVGFNLNTALNNKQHIIDIIEEYEKEMVEATKELRTIIENNKEKDLTMN